MATLVYTRLGANLAAPVSSGLSWTTDVIKVSLHTSGYVPTKTHNTATDLTNEISATSSTDYSAGGFTLANPTITETDTDNITKWDADDIALGNATLTARVAVVRLARTAGSSDLCMAYDFGSNQSASAGTFTVQWSTGGMLQFQST